MSWRPKKRRPMRRKCVRCGSWFSTTDRSRGWKCRDEARKKSQGAMPAALETPVGKKKPPGD